MRIPSEHFTDVPVFALSPTTTPSGSRKTSEDSNADSSLAGNSNGGGGGGGNGGSLFPMFRRRSASAQRRRLSSSSSSDASDLQLNPAAASLASIPAEVDRSRSSPTKSFLNRFFAESSSAESPVKANNPRVKLRRSNTMSVSSTSLHRPQQQQRPLAAASAEEAKRSQMNVCVDCKDMILQIIKVQRANRRRQLTRSLCLS